MGKWILGGILGGLVAFIWIFVSWTILLWHDSQLHGFKDSAAVTTAIQENTLKDGCYVFPQMDKDTDPTKIIAPFIYAQVRKEGIDFSNPKLLVFSFLTQFIGAFLITILLLKANIPGYAGRLCFVTIIGLTIGLLAMLPNWIWMGAGTCYTGVMIIDYTVTWFLSGIVLAAIGKKKVC